MATGMWTAAAGASAQSQNLDTISNNLANSDSVAFKKDIPTFKEYLTTVERNHEAAEVSPVPIQDKDLYPIQGRDQSYVVLDGTYTNHEQGHLRVTQRQFDIALDGPGFLEVSTPQGIRYTRAGSLKTLPDGKLSTTDGYPVMSAQAGGMASNGITSPAGYFINIRDQGSHFSITENGEIYSGDRLVGQLKIAEFSDLKKLKKQGGQLFENLDSNNLKAANKTRIHQGVLETSNVNPIEEMTNMIKANRLFEHDLKALKTYGEMMGKEANEVGKL